MFRRLMLITFALLVTCTVAHGQERFKAEAICARYPQLCPNGVMAEDWPLLKKRALALDASPPGLQADLRQGWPVHCRRDAIYDTKSCAISRGSLHVFLIKDRQGDITAMVSIIYGDKPFPGRRHAIRIDQRTPHTTTDDASWHGADATVLITHLTLGHIARTRFFAWPYENAKDDEIPLDGFSDALAALARAVRQP